MKIAKYVILLTFVFSLSCISRTNLGGWAASPKLQGEATIKITNTCMLSNGSFQSARGSGVAVSGKYALTAYHVVDCPTSVQSITVERSDGQQLLAELDTTVPAQDIARLKLTEGKFKHYVTHIAPAPDSNDVICSESAVPGWNRKCGWVEKHVDMPNGDIRHSAVHEPGNSGSGVYNEDGELVGIVTMLYFCPNLYVYGTRQVCGGYASSIWKAKHLMP